MKKIMFWRRTPPAIFPPILGLFGLGLGWRHASAIHGLPPGPAEALLGAITLIFAFAAFAYAAKLARRPRVVVEDLRTLPGRAGVAALTMSTMLLAATLFRYFPAVARAIFAGGFFAHLLLIGETTLLLVRRPLARRVVTPVMHLTFVGVIVAPIAAAPMGYGGLSELVFVFSGMAALVIWAASLGPLVLARAPAPLRPVQAIHLSAASLLGEVALLLGYSGLGIGFGLVATAILLLLLLRARWLTAAGFSPFWGAFTFPAAAYANLMMGLGRAGGGESARVIGAAALVAATLIIVPITLKIMQAWARGTLAAKTNAASA